MKEERKNRGTALKEKLAEGNISAFNELFTLYYKYLCRYANTFLNDPEEARDIAQAVMIKVWENKHNFSQIKNLEAYLLRSVKNNILNTLKSKKYNDLAANSVNGDILEMELEEQEEDISSELYHQLNNYIEQLPEQCRKIFKLSRFGGLSNKEIAEELNIGHKAVESNITRALKALKIKMSTVLTIFFFI